jgi:hypothetical protein
MGLIQWKLIIIMLRLQVLSLGAPARVDSLGGVAAAYGRYAAEKLCRERNLSPRKRPYSLLLGNKAEN